MRRSCKRQIFGFARIDNCDKSFSSTFLSCSAAHANSISTLLIPLSVLAHTVSRTFHFHQLRPSSKSGKCIFSGCLMFCFIELVELAVTAAKTCLRCLNALLMINTQHLQLIIIILSQKIQVLQL